MEKPQYVSLPDYLLPQEGDVIIWEPTEEKMYREIGSYMQFFNSCHSDNNRIDKDLKRYIRDIKRKINDIYNPICLS